MVISVRVFSTVAQIGKKVYKDGDCDVEACIENYLPVCSVTAAGAIELLRPIREVKSLPPKSHPDNRMSLLHHNHPYLKLAPTSAYWTRPSKCLVYVLIIQLMPPKLMLYSCRSPAASTSKSPIRRAKEALADLHKAPYSGGMPPS